jgi:hypothetical protein
MNTGYLGQTMTPQSPQMYGMQQNMQQQGGIPVPPIRTSMGMPVNIPPPPSSQMPSPQMNMPPQSPFLATAPSQRVQYIPPPPSHLPPPNMPMSTSNPGLLATTPSTAMPPAPPGRVGSFNNVTPLVEQSTSGSMTNISAASASDAAKPTVIDKTLFEVIESTLRYLFLYLFITLCS